MALAALLEDFLRPILDLLSGYQLVRLHHCGNACLNERLRSLVERFELTLPVWTTATFPRFVSLFPRVSDVAIRIDASHQLNTLRVLDCKDILTELPRALRALRFAFSNDFVPFLNVLRTPPHAFEMVDLNFYLPNVTSLHFDYAFGDCPGPSFKFHPKRLPAGLTELVTKHHVPIHAEEVAELPKGLQTISLDIIESHTERYNETFPPTLTSLRLRHLPRQLGLNSLPRTLTHLETSFWAKGNWNWTELPRSLKILSCSDVWQLDLEMMMSLPESVTDLTISVVEQGNVEDSALQALPKFLKRFSSNSLGVRQNHSAEILLSSLPNTLLNLDLTFDTTADMDWNRHPSLHVSHFFLRTTNPSEMHGGEQETRFCFPQSVGIVHCCELGSSFPASHFGSVESLWLGKHVKGTRDLTPIGELKTLRHLTVDFEMEDFAWINEASFVLSTLSTALFRPLDDYIYDEYVPELDVAIQVGGPGAENPDFSKPSLSSLSSLSLVLTYHHIYCKHPDAANSKVPKLLSDLLFMLLPFLHRFPSSLLQLDLSLSQRAQLRPNEGEWKTSFSNRCRKIQWPEDLLLYLPKNLLSLKVGPMCSVPASTLPWLSKRMVVLSITGEDQPDGTEEEYLDNLPKTLHSLRLPYTSVECSPDNLKRHGLTRVTNWIGNYFPSEERVDVGWFRPRQ